MTLSMILAMASGTALLASGYLFGAKRGRSVRASLAVENAKSLETIARQEAEMAELAKRLPTGDELRNELRGFMRTVEDQERNQDALREELREELRQGLAAIGKQSQASSPDAFRSEVQKVMQPLLRKQDDTAALREMLREMLAPMIERERIGKELSRLDAGSTLGELPRMLDAIAEKGGFATVVLSDDVGLPLAANSSALDVEMLAGMASFLLTLADRAERNGVPRPQAVVVLDESNQHVLHRIFAVDSVRFTLTAVSRGVHVTPGALDAALGKLEKVLTKRAA